MTPRLTIIAAAIRRIFAATSEDTGDTYWDNVVLAMQMDAPEYDQHWSNVVLAMHMEGANNGTSFVDLKGKTITVGGNAVTSTAQYKFGTSAAYFDGTGDYIGATDNSLQFTGDFTVEAWVYCTDLTKAGIASSRLAYTGGDNYWTFYVGTDGSLNSQTRNGTQYFASTAAGSITTNKWYHVAATRSSGVVRVFVDGVVGATSVNDGGISFTENTLAIGIFNYPGYVSTFAGYIDDLRVTKGVARYTSTFTPPTKAFPDTGSANDYWDSVVLQMHMEGANNGTTFTDVKGKTVTANGNAVTSTAQYKFGTSAAYFDGTGDYLTLSPLITAGDYTFEAWVYLTAYDSTNGNVIFSQGVAGDAGRTQLLVGATSPTLTLQIGSLGISGSTSVAVNTWHHIALTLSGTTARIFLNGALEATGTSPATIGGTESRIGQNWVTNAEWTGYIDELRVTQGAARYTSNFTPPTAAFADGPFIDLKNHAVTAYGNSMLTDSIKKYGTGCGYFDGTGDYLITDPIDLASSDFTVEAWVYPTALTSYVSIVGTYWWNAGYQGGWRLAITTAGALIFNANSGTPLLTSSNAAIATNSWQHVAATRSGSTWTLFVNGVSVATTTSSVACSSGYSTGTRIGAKRTDSGAIDDTLTGYIDDLRITKGVARYTANFTPAKMQVGPVATGVTYYDPFWSQTTTLIRADGGYEDDTDPYWNHVVLHMPMNGANGSTTFTETKGKTVTVGGNAQISTTQSRFGGASTYFDGNGDYLNISSTDLDYGTGDFTMECWVNFQGIGAGYPRLIEQASYPSTNGFTINLQNSTTTPTVSFSNYSSGAVASTTTLKVGEWTHIAATRASGTLRLFINGVKQGTDVTGDTTNCNSGYVRIGTGTGSDALNGYLDDVRLTKGVARYTANFGVPLRANPSALPTSYDPFGDKVVLAMHMEGANNGTTFVDQCGKTVTANGNAVTSTAQYKIGTSAAYFDGTGDYLSTPDSTDFTFGTSDFTVEFFMKAPSTSNYAQICGQRGAAGNPDVPFGITGSNTGNVLLFNYGNGSAFQFTTASTTTVFNDVWHHIACVRAGTRSMLFVDGVLESEAAIPAGYSLYDGTSNFSIGRAGDYNGQYYAGYLDDFRITKAARYVANFTPPTKAFINPILDVKSSSRDIVAYGNAAPSATQSKFGGKSLYVDGTGDYINFSHATDYSFGSGNFTVEFWYYPVAQGTYSAILTGDEPDYPFCIYHGSAVNSGNPVVALGPNGSSWFTNASSLTLGAMTNNTWYHIAVVRSGDTFSVFKDGTLTATGSTDSAGQAIGSITTFTVGKNNGFYLACYLDDLRITKGVARYTTNFIPPTHAFQDVTETDPYASSVVLHMPMQGQDDKYWDNVVLMLPMDGANASTSFYEAKGKTVTASGNAQISTAQSKYGVSSAYFDGTGDYLTVPASSEFSLASGDFTVELWVRTSTTSVIQCLLSCRDATGDGWQLYMDAYAGFYLQATGSSVASSATVLLAGAWQHLAVVRAGSTTTLYCNGVSVGTGTVTIGNSSATALSIAYNAIYSNNHFTGYIDDLRITKGVARYTAAFTPPIKQLFALEDKAGRGVKVAGDAKVSKAAQKYGWGSAYFDGTGDYLTIPYSSDFEFSTADFTVEFWINQASITGQQTILRTGANANGALFIESSPTATGRMNVYTWSGSIVVLVQEATTVYNTSQWYHIAIVRSGTTFSIFRDGVRTATGTSSLSLTYAHDIWVGSGLGSGDTHGNYLNGYLQDLRITKGVARYLANFDVPKRPLPLSYPQASYPSTVVGLKPSAYWRMDDTGTTMYDSMGTVNGTHTGVTVQQTSLLTGGYGKSTYYPGTGRTVIADNAIFNGYFTLSMLIKPVGTVGGMLMQKGNSYVSSNQGFQVVWLGATGNLRIAWFNSGWQSIDTTGPILTSGETQHLTVAYNGSSVKFYINGILKESVSLVNPFVANSQPLYFCVMPNDAGGSTFQSYVNAYIDEFSWWPSVLTDAEIAAVAAKR